MSATSLALVKEFFQITHSRQDNVVQALINSAEAFIAKHIGVEVASATFVEDLPRAGGPLDATLGLQPTWPSRGDDYLILTHRPVIAVASVTDNFAGDQVYPFKLIDSRIVWSGDSGQPLGRWPQGVARFHVTYTAGYSVVPPAITEAVCELCYRAYNARGGEVSTSVAGVSAAFSPILQSDILAKLKAFNQRPMVGF